MSAATWRAPGLKRSASDRPDQHHCKVNLKKDDIARGLGCARTTNQPQRHQACTLSPEERR